MGILPEKIGIDFTDERLTSSAGSLFLSRTVGRLGIARMLRESIRVKKRRRGVPEAEALLAAIASLAQGDGCLCDVDRLRADRTRSSLWGLSDVVDSRRLGELLARFDASSLAALGRVAHEAARRVIGEVVGHERATRGYVPLFLDGSAIEVTGRYFEQAAPGYDEIPQYWLHSAFVGPLWISQTLLPGGVAVTEGWRARLDAAADLLGDTDRVWARMDNAYYNGDVVRFCREKGWDFSISVTHDIYKQPLKRQASWRGSTHYTPINGDGTEEASLITHRPEGWEREESYVVIRSWMDGAQRRLHPRMTFILVSRTDLPLDELVRRHRGKQGQENAQKGPLIELDLHHPPCASFMGNCAFYTLGQIAQIVLIAAQYLLLPAAARRHGLRPIIRDLVRVPGRLVRHARTWTLKFAKTALRLDWLLHAADRLDAWNARAPGDLLPAVA